MDYTVTWARLQGNNWESCVGSYRASLVESEICFDESDDSAGDQDSRFQQIIKTEDK